MNPALLEYLQNQSMEQPSMQGPQDFQGASNPFDIGIRKAIDSARDSLSMTDKQQQKAFRRGLLAFGDRISQEPVQRGFINNLGAVGRSMGPAIGAYDASEDMALKDNNNLANQILHYQAAEQQRQAKEEEQLWRRQYMENQLAEQQRYHDMQHGHVQNQQEEQRRYHDMMMGRNNEGMNGEGAGEFIPITNKAQLNTYSKTKNGIGGILSELGDIEKKYKSFKKNYNDNLFEQGTPYSRAINPVKDMFGKFTNAKAFREETAHRESLNAELKRFNTAAERVLKGMGTMGIGILNYFDKENMYPSLDKDARETFEAKLQGIKETLEKAHKAANYSLQYGIQLDPSQLDQFEALMNGQQGGNQNEMAPEEQSMMPQGVKVQWNGQEATIAPQDLEGALQMGWEPVQ